MPFRSPVPATQPFSKQPLRWASPPMRGVPGSVPVPGQPFVNPEIAGPYASGPEAGVANMSSLFFGISVTGVKGTTPVLARVAVQRFDFPITLINISLSSSIVNASVTTPAVCIVHKDVGIGLNYQEGFDSFAEHIVEAGLSHVIRTGTSYADNIAPSIATNDRMAIYLLMENGACRFTGIVSVRYLTVS